MENDAPRPLYSPEESRRIRYENYQKTKTFNVFFQEVMEHAREHHIPYKGTFELTPRCSMRCKMCYMRLDAPQMACQGKELTAAEWIRLGQMAFDAGTVDLILTGGEPMLRPDFAEIYTALSDMGFLLRLFTNATLVTPEIMSLLRERPPQLMEITLYGASEDTYARVGGWGEGYARAVEAIDELRMFVPSITLKTTVIRDNAADYPAMFAFAEARALPLVAVDTPFPAVRGATADVRACRLSVDELIDFHEKNGIPVAGDSCSPPDPEARHALYCDAGLASYCVEWTGAMVACNADDAPDRPVAYPLRDGFDAAWEAMRGFHCGKALPEPCKTCPIYAQCSTCAVHHRIESGAFDIPARYCCDFYRKALGEPLLPDEAFKGQKKE